VVPAHVVRKRGLARVDSAGGLCRARDLGRRGARNVADAAAEGLRALAREHRAVHVTLSLPPLAPAWREARVNPLLPYGFRDVSGATWVVPLDGGRDEIWRGIQDGTRSQIRAAEDAGVRVRPLGPDEVGAYYDLHVGTYRRTGARPHPRAYFDAVIGQIVPSGRARAYVAEHEGRPVAAMTSWREKGGAGYWTGASSEAGRRLHANDLLQWWAMAEAADDGLEAFDSGEASAQVGKAGSISAFKRKFGGTLAPLFRGRLDTGNRLVVALARIADAQPLARSS
jgi:hypothetical protein